MTHPVLHLDSMVTQEVTVLSNTFIDFYMVRANGEFVKIYLYFLRHSTHTGEPVTLSGAADALSLTEGDVMRALLYWEREGLVNLSMQEGQLTGIHLLPISPPDIKGRVGESGAGTAAPKALPMRTPQEKGAATPETSSAFSPKADGAAASNAKTTPKVKVTAAPETSSAAAPETDSIDAKEPDTGKQQRSESLPGSKDPPDAKVLPVEAQSASAAGSSSDANENRSPVTGKAARPSRYRNSKKAGRYTQVPAYTQEELLRFQEHTDEDLLFVISRYLGRNLGPTDLNTIVFFEEHLGFSSELIEYLFEFCASNQHYNIHYIETVALNWAENDIDTPAKARSYCSLYNRDAYTILKYLGRDNHTLTPTELEYINRWTKTYGFPLTIIEEACRRAVLKSSPPSLKYTDSILKKWYEQKVGSMEDIRKLDAAHAYASGSLQAAAGTAADARTGTGADVRSGISPVSSGDPSGRQADGLTESKQAAGPTGSAQASGWTGSKQAADMAGTAQPSGKGKKNGPPGQPNRFHNFSQRTYDYSQMEDTLLKKYMQTLEEPKEDDPSQTDNPA